MDKIKQKTLNLSTNGDPLSEQTPLSSRGSARGSGGRQLERRGSFKGGFYQRSDRNSFDDQSFLSKPLSSARRRGSKNSVAIDVSDVSNFVDYDGGSGCCNMKLADLKLEKYTSSCFNSFEAGIIEARRVNKIKHTGRSIQSIRKKPSMSSMSIFSNAGKSLRAVVSWFASTVAYTIVNNNMYMCL